MSKRKSPFLTSIPLRSTHPRTCLSIFTFFTLLPLLIIFILYTFIFTLPPCPSLYLDPTNPVHDIVLKAGRTSSDVERYDHLLSLKSSGYDVKDLDKLLPTAHRYAYPSSEPYVSEMYAKSLLKLGETGYLGGYFWDKVWPTKISMFLIGEVYPEAISPDSDVYPVYCLYRGRMVAHAVLENNILEKDMYKESGLYLGCARKHFGEEGNDVLGMYTGRGIEWEDGTVGDAGDPPLWAKELSKATEKLREISYFWVRERQLDNGEFGGGTNDDVEMWRQLKGLIIGFEDGETVEGTRRLGDGVWGMDRMRGGFVDELHDVEHSAEESSDSLLPLLLMNIDEASSTPLYSNVGKIRDLFLNKWMGSNAKGGVMFKSTFFSSIEVSSDPRMMCDVALNIRAIQPVLLGWQYNRLEDNGFEERVKEWMSNWIESASAADCGKPRYVIPSALRYPSSSPGGPITSGWQNPGCKYVCLELERFGKVCEHHRDAFTWPSAIKPMSEVMALVAFKSKWCGGLRSLLDAVIMNEDIKEKNEDWDGKSEMGSKGSSEWVQSINLRQVMDGIVKWKFLTDGGTDFDDAIQTDDRYTNFLLKRNYDYGDGNFDQIKESLEKLGKGFSYNKEALTSEVRFTDRTFKFFKYARKMGFDKDQYPATSKSAELIYNVVTGDIKAPSYASVQAVGWVCEGGRDFAVVVTKNKVDAFEAVFYSFRSLDRVVGMRLKRLVGLGTKYDYKLVKIREGEEGNSTVCEVNEEVVGSGGEFTVQGGLEGEGGSGDWPLVNLTVPGGELLKVCVSVASSGSSGGAVPPFGQDGSCRGWLDTNTLIVNDGDQGDCKLIVRPVLPLLGITVEELIACVVAVFAGFVGGLMLCFCRIEKNGSAVGYIEREEKVGGGEDEKVGENQLTIGINDVAL